MVVRVTNSPRFDTIAMGFRADFKQKWRRLAKNLTPVVAALESIYKSAERDVGGHEILTETFFCGIWFVVSTLCVPSADPQQPHSLRLTRMIVTRRPSRDLAGLILAASVLLSFPDMTMGGRCRLDWHWRQQQLEHGRNWTGGFVPEAQFEEVGVINNGDTAFIAVGNSGRSRPRPWSNGRRLWRPGGSLWWQHRFCGFHGRTGRVDYRRPGRTGRSQHSSRRLRRRDFLDRQWTKLR